MGDLSMCRMEILSDDEWVYLYSQMIDCGTKFPAEIYRKIMTGSRVTREEELIIQEAVRKDMEQNQKSK